MSKCFLDCMDNNQKIVATSSVSQVALALYCDNHCDRPFAKCLEKENISSKAKTIPQDKCNFCKGYVEEKTWLDDKWEVCTECPRKEACGQDGACSSQCPK